MSHSGEPHAAYPHRVAADWSGLAQQHRADKAQLIALAALSMLLREGLSDLTMSNIAASAGVSRQTLYRYYGDVNDVLVGIADLLATHDDTLRQHVLAQPTPTARFDALAAAVSASEHGDLSPSNLMAVLPPTARAALANHQAQTEGLLADILRAGVESGEFRSDLSPDHDAALLLGLLSASTPERERRARDLAWQLIAPTPTP